MKITRASILSRAALLAVAAVAIPSIVVTSSAAPARVASADDPLPMEKLKEEVAKRHAVGDSAGVASLLKANPQNTIVWVIELNESFALRPDDKLGEQMKMLRTGWRKAFDSDFFENTEKFLARLRPEMRTERDRLRVKYTNLYLGGPYDEVFEKRTKYDGSTAAPAKALSVEFERLADAFAQLGDLYHASQAAMHAGYLVDSTMIHGDADLARAHALLSRALQHRKELDLEDQWARHLAADIERLSKLVVPPEAPAGGEGEAGGEAGAPAAPMTTSDDLPGVALGPVTTSEGAFEAIPAIDTYERMGYAADQVFMLWMQVYLAAEGSTQRFPAIAEGGPVIHRTGASAAEVVGVDGAKAEIPLTGRAELVKTTTGTADAPRPWAVLMQLPSDKEQYQGFEVNFSPTTTQLTLSIAPAGAMRHTIGGVPVLVLDENLDGVYGGPGMTWSYPGMSADSYQLDVDALVIGKSKRAVPFSELVQVEGKWYRLESVDGGARLAWQPATLRTGKVSVDAKGIDPHTVIVKGSGPLENCYFDLAASRGAVELPVGTYTLAQGTVRRGKRMEVEKALFLGVPTTTINVLPDASVKLTLGAPFDIDAKIDIDEKHVRVTGNTIVVTGQAGERYQRLWGFPLKPEIAFRKTGTKRASRPEKLPLVVDQETVNEKGLPVAWFPLSGEFEHNVGSADVEVQFTQKKHPLFGNLESTWR